MTTVGAAVMPGADVARYIPALGRLPVGVTTAVEHGCWGGDAGCAGLYARYADALLEAVVTYYDLHTDVLNRVSFYCLALAGMAFEDEMK